MEDIFTKKELILLISLATFSLIWVAVAIPAFSTSTWFAELIPPIQFILFNVGFLCAYLLLVGVTLSYVINGGIEVIMVLKYGLTFWFLESFVLDMSFQPPYFLNSTGQVLLDVPEALTGTSVDGMIAWCWQQIGVSGSLLYYLTYWFVPIITLVGLAALLAPKQFIGLFATVAGKTKRKR